MHIVKALLQKFLIGAAIILILLSISPLLVDLEKYKDRILSEINRDFPGRLDVRNTQLMFVPHVGIRVYDLTLLVQGKASQPQPLFQTSKAMLYLDLKEALSGRKKLTFETRSAKLGVPLRQGAPLLRQFIDYVSKTKSQTFEFEGITLQNLKVETLSSTEDRFQNVRIEFKKTTWKASAQMPSKQTAVSSYDSSCQAGTPDGIDQISGTLGADRIEISNWSTPKQSSPPWTGHINWDGNTQLSAGKSSLAGKLYRLECRANHGR